MYHMYLSAFLCLDIVFVKFCKHHINYIQLDCLPLTPKKLVTSYPEGLTACPAPSCKRALATGFNNWSVQRSTGNHHKQPNPLRRHLACLCSQRTVPWHWQSRGTGSPEGRKNKFTARGTMRDEEGDFPLYNCQTGGCPSPVRASSYDSSISLILRKEPPTPSISPFRSRKIMHHVCEFNGWPTFIFQAYWVSDWFQYNLRSALIREYK